MSYDVMSVVRDGEDVRFAVASSCKPEAIYPQEGEKASFDDSFDHIDGVFIEYDPEGDSVFFDTTKKIIRDWIIDDEGEETIVDLDTENTWTEYDEVRKNLATLFNDHWPSLGEIADVLSLTNNQEQNA